jgi:hypothetical protein
MKIKVYLVTIILVFSIYLVSSDGVRVNNHKYSVFLTKMIEKNNKDRTNIETSSSSSEEDKENKKNTSKYDENSSEEKDNQSKKDANNEIITTGMMNNGHILNVNKQNHSDEIKSTKKIETTTEELLVLDEFNHHVQSHKLENLVRMAKMLSNDVKQTNQVERLINKSEKDNKKIWLDFLIQFVQRINSHKLNEQNSLVIAVADEVNLSKDGKSLNIKSNEGIIDIKKLADA